MGASLCPVCGTPVPDEYAEQHYTHDCEGAPMTTHVSRERREAVAERLACYFEDYDQWPAQDREDVANEIIAAALPDRVAFIAVVGDLIEAAIENESRRGDTDEFMDYVFDPEWTATNDAKAALIALVYDADDAQAGDQEGAEHE